MITIHDIEQGTPEWLKMREELYTGSNAHKLLEHANKVRIVDGKVSPYAIAEITGFKGNFYTDRGHMLEEEAIELYEQITGKNVDRPGFVTNSKWPGSGYSPDGTVTDRTIEVKSFNVEKHKKLIAGELDIKILAQVHFGQLICGKKLTDFVAYNPVFAKKEFIVNGFPVPNPDYDPKSALVIITIKHNPKIAANFKRILSGK